MEVYVGKVAANALGTYCAVPNPAEKALRNVLVDGAEITVTVYNDGSVMLKRGKTDKEKKREWITHMMEKFNNETLAESTCSELAHVTSVAVWDGETNNLEIGMSKPSPEDDFDPVTGIAVAYAKARGIHIPSYI